MKKFSGSVEYNFDRNIDRKGTDSEKWDYLDEFYGSRDILPMWVADMDFAAPEPVVEALVERAEHGVYGYTGVPESCYDAIINWVYRRHGWRINKEWIIFAPGVVPGISMSLMAYTNPGDKVVIQSPVYHLFHRVVNNNGRTLMDSQLKVEGGRYVMDFEGLEDKFKAGAKALILCSPHNPVGRVWTSDELTRLGELCTRYGVVILSDEIHSDIVYNGYKHIPIAAIEGVQQNIVTFMAPSKTFNVAGLSMSFAVISNPDLRKRFKRVIGSIGIESGNLFGIKAMEAAYSQGEEWLDQLLEYLEGNMDYLLSYVNKNIPRIKVQKCEATYLAWLDCRNLSMSHKELEQFMVQKARIGLNSGIMFGPGGEGFMRMNIGCPRSLLQEGLRRIEKAAADL